VSPEFSSCAFFAAEGRLVQILIDFPAMAYAVNQNCVRRSVYAVDYAVIPDSQAIEFLRPG
jgi:hypothetical protein